MTSLIPVLELTPGSYSSRERPHPSESAAENPQAWFQYWSEALRDAGITGLNPWAPGSWLVTVDQLVDPVVLKAIVGNAFGDVTEWSLDEIGALSGGYVLSHDGSTLLPGCCGDLGNLEEWQRAVTLPNEDWTMLWIGHPWTFVRALDQTLHFAEPTEQ